ncbi:MAG: STAS/SEC14 domain-containing protein [Salinarimonadaceae bacterium]|nr:MAG: STAS/SEC14 domain-containing protein [Salinarimonadaceae bacterium]
MLVVNESSDSDIVVVKMSGVVTAAEIDVALPQIERIFEERERLRFYVELIGLESHALLAAWREATFFLRHRGKIERAAFIVSSPGERAVGWVGELFMGGESREFSRGEEALALAWLKADASRA